MHNRRAGPSEDSSRQPRRAAFKIRGAGEDESRSPSKDFDRRIYACRFEMGGTIGRVGESLTSPQVTWQSLETDFFEAIEQLKPYSALQGNR